MKVGILGGGQLARMLALAGYPLGLEFVILEPSSEAGAISLGEHLQGDYEDKILLKALAEKVDVVTYEFENVPAPVANFLSKHTQVYPRPDALAFAQDRLIEKNLFHQLKIPTVPFIAIASLDDLQQAMTTIGYPAILKSRQLGYDGKGQVILKTADDLTCAWQSIQQVPAIVEGLVNFQREVSILAARNPSGDVVYYPLSENKHYQGILRVAQCSNNDALQQQAQQYLSWLINKLNYVGLIALELFEVEGQLLANEFAPRVHNSAHWSIEGSETSQFENHLRAILNLPLGSTATRGFTGMVNFIGGLPDCKQLLQIEHTHLHLYHKSPRKNRKVAHVGIRADQQALFSKALASVISLAKQSEIN
jgi:5-(carboxyamino)imidazole ribonucleotide synthase